MKTGKFITLEGGEGAGKSTQARRLADYLRGQGIDVVLTREVGGCPSAEQIRELWLGKGEGQWDIVTEVFLINAARREHLVKTVWPALQRGAWVVSDRFVDSTRAYQGIGLEAGIEEVDACYRAVAGAFDPDLTLLFDLPVEEGLRRVGGRGGQDDRYERKDQAFHQKLRDAYLGLARHDPARIVIIDAAGTADDVAAAAAAAARRHFSLPA